MTEGFWLENPSQLMSFLGSEILIESLTPVREEMLRILQVTKIKIVIKNLFKFLHYV